MKTLLAAILALGFLGTESFGQLHLRDECGNVKGDTIAAPCSETASGWVGEPQPEVSVAVVPDSLSLFVMAQCSYGLGAMAMLAKVQPLLPPKTEVRIHYLVRCDTTGYCTSMHGEGEVLETIIQKHLQADTTAFHRFIDARTITFGYSRWSPDVALFAIGALQEKEALQQIDKEAGQSVLDDARQAAALGVGSSPTLIVSGLQHRLTGEDAVIGYLDKLRELLGDETH